MQLQNHEDKKTTDLWWGDNYTGSDKKCNVAKLEESAQKSKLEEIKAANHNLQNYKKVRNHSETDLKQMIGQLYPPEQK